MNNLEQKLKVLEELRSYDHCFIDEEGVKHFTEPFGFESETLHLAEDSRYEPKGLALPEGKPMVGADAADLAEEIAFHVCGFKRFLRGRGFRLRAAIDAAESHLKGL